MSGVNIVDRVVETVGGGRMHFGSFADEMNERYPHAFATGADVPEGGRWRHWCGNVQGPSGHCCTRPTDHAGTIHVSHRVPSGSDRRPGDQVDSWFDDWADRAVDAPDGDDEDPEAFDD